MPTRPYRWGQFQGWCVAFVGLVMIVGGLWVHDTHGMMLALFGFFSLLTGVGLIGKKKYAVVFLYIICVIVLLSRLFPHSDDPLYPIVHFLEILFWCVPAIFYYPKRWIEFA